MILRELRIVWQARAGIEAGTGEQLRVPQDAAHLFNRLLAAEPIEVFGLLCLTTKHHVIGYHEVSRGTLDSAPIHPREVFKAAFLANAASVVIGHNHPSGEPAPSPEDRSMTERLVQVSGIVGIPILDHIIVGETGRYYSFRESRELQCLVDR